MKDIVNKLIVASRMPFLRIALGVGVVVGYELYKNWEILDRLTLRTFTALIFPYVLVFILWFALFWNFKLTTRSLPVTVVLGGALWVGTLPFAYAYYYEWLPRIDIVFWGELNDSRRLLFEAKVKMESVLILLIAVADHLFWNRLLLFIQNKKLDAQLSRVTDSGLLSAHYLREIIQFLKLDNKPIDIRVMKFFSYVLDRIDLKAPLVSLEEEWQQMQTLMEIYKFRNFEIIGAEVLTSRIACRSVPALVLLTFLANAIKYSPRNDIKPIQLRWSMEDGQIVFSLRNVIADNLMPGSGQGLLLADRLLKETYDTRYSLRYGREESQNVFFVRFAFKL